MAFLASIPVSYTSIRSYLSAVRHLQISSGLPDPAATPSARLDYMLKGVRRQGRSTPRPTRMPITPQVILQVWSQDPPSFDRKMLWAAFCLGFFAFMRAGEFTCPSREAYTPNMLTASDVHVDSHLRPTRLAIHIRESKTDQFGIGAMLHLVFEDGASLSREWLVQALSLVLHSAGIDSTRFSGHSFRIGAAAAAANAGLSDSMIQTLGQWKSSAFNGYIQTPWQRLTAVSTCLASSDSRVAPGFRTPFNL